MPSNHSKYTPEFREDTARYPEEERAADIRRRKGNAAVKQQRDDGGKPQDPVEHEPCGVPIR